MAMRAYGKEAMNVECMHSKEAMELKVCMENHNQLF